MSMAVPDGFAGAATIRRTPGLAHTIDMALSKDPDIRAVTREARRIESGERDE